MIMCEAKSPTSCIVVTLIKELTLGKGSKRMEGGLRKKANVLSFWLFLTILIAQLSLIEPQ